VTTGTPISPRLVKGGIVTMDPDTSVVLTGSRCSTTRIRSRAACRYRRCRAGRMGCAWMRCGCAGRRLRPSRLRLRWTLSTNSSFPKKYPLATKYGLHPQLAQLEMLVNPTVETLLADDAMANAGTLEIIPLEQPLTLFGVEQQPRHSRAAYRIQHHRGSLRPDLNPIRAKLSLGNARAERR